MALSNLFDTTAAPTPATPGKVTVFERQLMDLNLFSPFPLPPDVAACFVDLPEEMMSIVREHAQQLDVTKDAVRSFIDVIVAAPFNPAGIVAVRQELINANLVRGTRHC
jgi:hypothetical protein